MNTPNCALCGRPVDLAGDGWRRLADGQYQHLACPISLEMQSLPLAGDAGAAVPAGGTLPRFITMDEAAELLRVSKATIRNRVRSGELPAKRLRGGQTVLVEIRDVLALLDDYTGGD